MSNQAENLVGKVFGRLSVLGRTDVPGVFWDCQCACGTLKTVRGQNLRSGNTQSCGCLRNDRVRASGGNTKHGLNKGKGTSGFVAREANLYYNYGLTPEDWQRLLEEQSGVCAICSEQPPSEVDHDHSCCAGEKSCGKCVRGLVCGRCNRVLGMAQDSIDVLMRAIVYLERI